MGFSCVELLSRRMEYNGQIESLENFVVVERDGLNIIIFISFFPKHVCLYSAAGGLWELVQHPWEKTHKITFFTFFC